jgi:hypothetical protein
MHRALLKKPVKKEIGYNSAANVQLIMRTSEGRTVNFKRK